MSVYLCINVVFYEPSLSEIDTKKLFLVSENGDKKQYAPIYYF